MPRWKLIVACVASVILAIPGVTFVSALVVFPIAVYAVFAAIANFAPPVLFAAAGLRRAGLSLDTDKVFEAWAFCAILWVGCAYGLSHWGDAASSMGGRNSAYFAMLFAPWRLLMGYTIS